MRIAVIGAGAMGCLFGARFAQGGHDVVLVDVSGAVTEAIAANGVTTVRGDAETTTRLAATTEPAAVEPADAVVFFVKCYHTRAAADFARPLVRAGSVVASLQNGWGNGDVLAQHYDPQRLVMGVTYNSGLSLGPGRVRHPVDAPTSVGPYAGDDLAATELLAQAIRGADLEVETTLDVRTKIWSKLVLNAATLPTAALTGMTAGSLTAHGEMRELVSAVAREAAAVARAQGYAIDEQERVDAIHALLARAGDTKGSMLQDFEALRSTEIDVINGAVVDAGDRLGVPVPLNRALVTLVRSWESTRKLRAVAA